MPSSVTSNSAATQSTNVVPAHFVPFERMLDNDWNLAMSEGDRFLRGEGDVHETLARLAKRLQDIGIPYAVAGGMALYNYGFRRVTEDVDLIVTKPDLLELHKHLDGLGYLRPFESSKNLRDVQTKVKIEFLVAGEFPGDGKPKPVAFPDPRIATEVRNGLHVLTMPRLVELKLASGMTGLGRMKDIGDVEQLVQLLKLPRKLSEQLNEYVRPRYLEIWDSLHGGEQRYVFSLRCTSLRGQIKSFESIARAMPDLTAKLTEMQSDGLTIDERSQVDGDLAYFITSDLEMARRYNMEPENQVLFEG